MSTRIKYLIDSLARGDKIYSEKVKWREQLTEKIEVLDIELKSKLEAYHDSLSSIKSVYETKLKEKQALEFVVKTREDQLNQSILKRKEVESQVAIIELDVQLLEKNLALKIDKKKSLENHIGDLHALQESLRAPTNDDDEIKYELAMELLKKSAFIIKDDGDVDERLSELNRTRKKGKVGVYGDGEGSEFG